MPRGRLRGHPGAVHARHAPLAAPFIDACTAAGHRTVLAGTDDAVIGATMPFDFRYWGTAVPMGAALTVATNGYLFFGTGGSALTTGSLPSTFTPNGVVAPLWNDLVTQADGIIATAGATPDRRYVVQWSNVRVYASSTSRLNFEAVFNERDLSIDFLYTTMTGAVTSVVGLENQAGTLGIGGCPAGATTYSCVVPASAGVRFTPSL